jgi:GMP synthase-like glutamine amidotransferase
MRVVIVGNTADTDAGFVGDRLSEHGASFTWVNRDHPDELGAVAASFDLLVLLGSELAVHDPARVAAVASEVALVERTLAEGRPVLGICYGGQLLARASGANVTVAERPEVGWTEVESEDHRLVPPGPWFQFHADRWWPTDEVPAFARSTLSPQAFRWGRALGLQFHPEVKPTVAAGWVHQYADVVEAAGVEPDQVLADIDRLAPAAAVRCARLVDMFLEDVAGSPPTTAHQSSGVRAQ